MASTSAEQQPKPDLPDITISVRQIFGIYSDMQVPAFANLFFLVLRRHPGSTLFHYTTFFLSTH